MNNAEYVCEQIDRLITVEFRVYGVQADDSKPQTRGATRKLFDAAREAQGTPLMLTAAQGLVDAIRPGDVVVITTGWVVPFWIPRGETDGAPGALAIGKALSSGLGARVVFVSEESVVPVLRAGGMALGLREYDLDFLLATPETGSGGGVAFTTFTTDPAAATQEARNMLTSLKPSAVIAIEKAGRNDAGVYHTGLGNDFTETCAKTDILTDEARRNGVFTVGIIDIGNEIGSGIIADVVREIIPWGRSCNCPCGQGIASSVETDSLIVSAACNFGGYGLTAALGAILGDLSIIHDVEAERIVMQECGRAGAIDGAMATSGGYRILNGVPFEDYSPLIRLLSTIAKAKDIRMRINRLRL